VKLDLLSDPDKSLVQLLTGLKESKVYYICYDWFQKIFSIHMSKRVGHWARIMGQKRTCMNLNCMNLKYECKLEFLEGRGWAQRFKLINTPLEGAGGRIDFMEK